MQVGSTAPHRATAMSGGTLGWAAGGGPSLTLCVIILSVCCPLASLQALRSSHRPHPPIQQQAKGRGERGSRARLAAINAQMAATRYVVPVCPPQGWLFWAHTRVMMPSRQHYGRGAGQLRVLPGSSPRRLAHPSDISCSLCLPHTNPAHGSREGCGMAAPPNHWQGEGDVIGTTN